MSELTTEPLTALGNALSALGGPSNGQRTLGENDMLARILTILGVTASYKTTSHIDLLVGIRNALSGAADLSASTSSEAAILADIAGLSRLTSKPSHLWDAAMAVIGASSGPATLAVLTLSAYTIAENSAEDTVVGTVQGATVGSTLSLTDSASGKFKLVGGAIKAGASPTDYEAATSHNITVRETLAGATNTPHDTFLTITVTDVADGLPAWVEALRAPSGDLPLVAGDFANDRYWMDGALSTVSAVFVADASWRPWDPVTDITPAAGITALSNGPILSPAAIALLPAGATQVLIATMDDADTQSITGIYGDFTTADPYYQTALSSPLAGKSLIEAYSITPSQDVTVSVIEDALAGVNSFAVTHTPTRIAGSLNGAAVVAATAAAPDLPFAALTIATSATTAIAFALWAIYAPQPEADLPALSA